MTKTATLFGRVVVSLTDSPFPFSILTVHKTHHRKLKTELLEPHKNWGDYRCFGRISRSYSTCDTCRVDLISTNPMPYLSNLFLNVL